MVQSYLGSSCHRTAWQEPAAVNKIALFADDRGGGGGVNVFHIILDGGGITKFQYLSPTQCVG